MEQVNHVPSYWKNSLEDIEESLGKVKRGKVSLLARSAGGRDIHLVTYGTQEEFHRKANYNSACGAGNPAYYADKSNSDRPVILIVGGTHGGELEGIVAVINLIMALETGEDLKGGRHDSIAELIQGSRLLLIPCLNPDGRARVPVSSMVGMPLDRMRYYMQGTWKDGTLCDWPGCKAIHPIRDAVEHLGAYFNDAGINLMHDNFFLPMAEETKGLMKLVDEEAVDATILLHGGANCINHIVPSRYVPLYMKERQYDFTRKLHEACSAKGLKFGLIALNEQDGKVAPPPSFNLTSALHHLSGGLSMTYESNMGLDAPGECYSYEDLLEHHFVLFEELLAFCIHTQEKPE